MEFPVWYPGDDNVPYLRHFAPHFPHVFVALNTFTDVSGYVPEHDLESEFYVAAEKMGAEFAVSWRRIADLCGFKSIARVNRALRGRPPKWIAPKYANEADTNRLLNVCLSKKIAPAFEEKFTPGTRLGMSRFVSALGLGEIIADDWVHGGELSRQSVNSYFDSASRCAPRFYAPDHSLIVMIWVGYHYALVCQTEASHRKANPADFFEGFDANKSTDDYWGIGTNADD